MAMVTIQTFQECISVVDLAKYSYGSTVSYRPIGSRTAVYIYIYLTDFVPIRSVA